MANINLAWTNPTETDIDNICVHRFDTDQSATYADDTLISATDAAAFAASATTVLNLSDGSYTYSSGAASFTDTVSAGTYTYGVFSKNQTGYGPGEAQTITVA
jgi:hypothetical protein